MSHENTISQLQPELITNNAAFDALRSEWLELWERSPEAGVFQRPEWLIPWWRHFGPDKSLRTVVLRAERRLAGLLPLAILHQTDGTRELQLIGTGNTDRLDAIVDPGYTTPAIDTWSCWLEESSSEWDRCIFAQLPPGSALLRLRAPATTTETCSSAEPCPVLRIPAAGQRARPRHGAPRRHATYLRRAEREGVRFVEATREDLRELLDALFELSTARWQERGEHAALADAAAQAFLVDACTELGAAGLLRLTALEQHRRIIGLYLGFCARGRNSAYIGGFDPEYSWFNPGTLLIGRVVESAAREGGHLDFLRGREQYKYDWGATDEVLFTRTFDRQPRPLFRE